jgi:hypothetical protein
MVSCPYEKTTNKGHNHRRSMRLGIAMIPLIRSLLSALRSHHSIRSILLLAAGQDVKP